MYWRFILSISTIEVVCTGNADNESVVYIFGDKIKAGIICWARRRAATWGFQKVKSEQTEKTQASLVPLAVLQTDNSSQTKTILFQNVAGSLHSTDDVRSDYNILKADVNVFVELKLCLSDRDDAYQLRKFTMHIFLHSFLYPFKICDYYL